MRKIFSGWSKSKTAKTDNSVADIFIKMNNVFKDFLMNYSLYVYVVTGFLILFCTVYYILDCKKQLDLKRRRQELRRASERISQQRRPGAAYREHEIFRSAIQAVRKYIQSSDAADGAKRRNYTLRRTRSGAIYGSFTDEGSKN